MGNKTIELLYAKLLNMDVFSDGIGFHAQTARMRRCSRLRRGEATSSQQQ